MILEIEKVLNQKVNSIIVPTINKEAYSIGFFNDDLFSIQLTAQIYDQIYNNNSIDADSLIKLLVKKVLEKNHIIVDKKSSETFVLNDFSKNIAWEPNILEKFNKGQKYIVVRGERASGKSSLVQYYCHQSSNRGHRKRKNNYLWLDFNCGACDFTDSIIKLINRENDNTETQIIILDNLECCGYDLSKSIVLFFAHLVELMDQNNRKARLLLIQNNDYKLEWFLQDEKTCFIDITKQFTLNYFRKKIEGPQINDYSIIQLLFPKVPINSFYLNTWNALSADQKTVLYKMLNLCSLGINPILSDDEIEIAKAMIDNNSVFGLKLYSDNRIQLYDIPLSKKFLAYINSYKKKDLAIPQTTNEYLHEYIENNPLTYQEIRSIWESIPSLFSKIPIEDYLFLIDLAKKYIQRIKKAVLSYNNDSLFENHLGAIVFAAEALSSLSDEDWDSIHCWHIIKQYIDETYFLGGQKLPEILLSREQNEGTYKDFVKSDKNKNSIENQIQLQDELLEKYPYIFPEQLNELNDSLFCYFLSQNQMEDKPVDIDRFFKTYILSLLFEFEVSAPGNHLDEKNVDRLFNMICLNAQKQNEMIYFYPARIPWVTARMLLALKLGLKCNDGFDRINAKHVEKCNKLISGLCRWLEKCNLKFTYNSENYRIWAAGTGKWNSAIETTMMCTFALCEAEEEADQTVVDEGLRYIIENKKESWFRNSYADGIWAYQNICMDDMRQQDLAGISNIREYLTPLYTRQDTPEKKNDRSLGETHIAKTLLSLIEGYSHAVENKIMDAITNQEGKTAGGNPETAKTNQNKQYTYKIGVTFTGKNRNNVKEVCEALIKYHDFSRNDIFFDNWHRSKIAGFSADDVLQDIYSRQCDCIVVFLSDDYMKKPWTGKVEWESIMTLIHSSKKRKILLFNTDSIDIDSIKGLNSKKDIFIPTNEMNTDNIALTIYDFFKERSTSYNDKSTEK